MIGESFFWKKDIKKLSKKIEKIQRRKFNDKYFFNIEKTIFNSAYSLRKLYQSHKLTDSFYRQDLKINYYKPIGHINKMNWWDIERVCDLQKPNIGSFKLDFLINQIIHSYVFIPIFDKISLKSILITSDKDRNKKIYEINILVFLNILIEASKNYPNSICFEYDEKIDDYKVSIK